MERDRRSRGMWELVSEAIARINSRLDELERRIDELSFCRPVFDESRVVEGEGLLGGRTYLASENGDVQKIIRIPTCDVCGSALGRGFRAICHHCGRKLCERCSISFEGRTHCIDCLRENHVNLGRREWKVLRCIASGVTMVSVIGRITGMGREEVRAIIAGLRAMGLVAIDGFWFLKRPKATEEGLVAVAIYDRIYGDEPGSWRFRRDLDEYAGR